ncbi:MAG: aromatic ring-hydroxylating dioxygenase subunit alpha [Pseudomonadota bacterium]
MNKPEQGFSQGYINTEKRPEPTLKNKPISGERYYTKEFMNLEWDRMWTKTWLVAGLESQIPKHGDYFTFDLGKESILCTRDRDGKVRTFYNVCQHRGNKLVHEEQGSSKYLVCAYHGWRFRSDGSLSFAPCAEDFAQGNPTKCGGMADLEEIRCEVFAGMIWYNLDPEAPTLREFLGPVMDEIAVYNVQDMVRTHWVTIEGDFNWKCVQDNFNESYHLPFVHPQTKYIMEQSYKYCQFDMFEKEGHARMFMPGTRPTMSLKWKTSRALEELREEIEFWGLDVEKYASKPHEIREAMQKIKREKGAEKGFDYSNFNDDQLTDHYHYTIFPNHSFSLKPDGCIWLRADPHPTDPEKCIFDMWYLTWFPKGETRYYAQSVSEWVDLNKPAPHVRGKEGEVSCGPAIDQDVEIWKTQQKGLRSRGYRGGYMPEQENRIKFFHQNLDTYLGID